MGKIVKLTKQRFQKNRFLIFDVTQEINRLAIFTEYLY